MEEKKKKPSKKPAGKRPKRRQAKNRLPTVTADLVPDADRSSTDTFPAPYDETLLERCRTQLQFGDWESLTRLQRDTMQHHPERAKLALLAAAGHLQSHDLENARGYIRLAQEWGCSRQMISRILIAGVHNTLGRAALASGQQQQALHHFKTSIAIITPGADIPLISKSRIIRESTRLGLLPQAADLVQEQLNTLKQERVIRQSHIKILETEIGLIHYELSLAIQRKQLSKQVGDVATESAREGSEEWLSSIKQKSVSQLGQDVWVLEKTGYKRGGFFVEFGATDGVLLSNTWLLEKEFYWQGICAEPNPRFFEQLRRNRSCRVSDRYIGGETGKEVDFILADEYGSSAEYARDDVHKDIRDAFAAAGKMITIVSISLDDFLEQHKAPRIIDYISVDTEGSEYEILKDFPFDKWDVRLMTVEHNYTERRQDIRALLEAQGYVCTEREFDDWFEKTA